MDARTCDRGVFGSVRGGVVVTFAAPIRKPELALLEKAFAAEVQGALTRMPGIMQSRAKLAEKLVADGLLLKARVEVGPAPFVVIDGYVLSEAGRYLYCTSCVGTA